jgi:hypothetical protein
MLLHEAAYGIAATRGILDTSRGGPQTTRSLSRGSPAPSETPPSLDRVVVSRGGVAFELVTDVCCGHGSWVMVLKMWLMI